jgi:hypothetical protein
MALRKETPKVYSMELPSTFPRPPAPGLTFHYLSPQPSQPGCWSEGSTNRNSEDNGSPITAAERVALNEAMCKLVSRPSVHKLVLTESSKQILPKCQPILCPEHQASRLTEILQRRDWTIYQLASLRSHLGAYKSIMLEEIGREETTEFYEDSDNTANDIHDVIEAFIAAVSRIVVSEQAPLDA